MLRHLRKHNLNIINIRMESAFDIIYIKEYKIICGSSPKLEHKRKSSSIRYIEYLVKVTRWILIGFQYMYLKHILLKLFRS